MPSTGEQPEERCPLVRHIGSHQLIDAGDLRLLGVLQEGAAEAAGVDVDEVGQLEESWHLGGFSSDSGSGGTAPAWAGGPVWS